MERLGSDHQRGGKGECSGNLGEIPLDLLTLFGERRLDSPSHREKLIHRQGSQ